MTVMQAGEMRAAREEMSGVVSGLEQRVAALQRELAERDSRWGAGQAVKRTQP